MSADRIIQVLICDDSAIFRSYWSKILSGHSDIKIVGTAANAQIALDDLKLKKPDLVILDIEMPVLDGISAIPLLLKINPTLKIIMASSLTFAGSEKAVEALALGASDYIPKPKSSDQNLTMEDVGIELLSKIRALVPKEPREAKPKASNLKSNKNANFVALAIGTSTGGPAALEEVFKTIPKEFKAPIFITQHMPPFFITALAKRISNLTNRNCVEPKHGDLVQGGTIYLAPGDMHLLVKRKDKDAILELSSAPPENFCRPAVDPMFRSLAEVYAGGLLGIVLTGMGEDGCAGAKKITECGGRVLVQDEESSVVWGMPGAVAKAGLASEILPLNRIGEEIWKLFPRS